jgi:homospermidine synthase
MFDKSSKVAFNGRILLIGFGSVAQCALPLFLRHIKMPPSRITVLDYVDKRKQLREYLKQGVVFRRIKISKENIYSILAEHVGSGDIVVDLAWNIKTSVIMQWCGEHNVRYINTSVEEWDPYQGIHDKPPFERSLYFRQMELRRLKSEMQARQKSIPTMLVDHGANPGLVSHFVKRALLEIGTEMLKKKTDITSKVTRSALEGLVARAKAGDSSCFAHLAQATGTKVIHISERDTQVADCPKGIGEFVNTWSVEGFYEEGTTISEMGWGTHERRLPPLAHVPEGGPGNQIFLAKPGIRTLVYSWVPKGGQIIGFVIRHAESFTISDFLTVWEEAEPGVRRPLYRPTVHYAYMPCNDAILSLHELTMHNYMLQRKKRIMNDEIVDGIDELGVLLLGHGLNGWWAGSQLSIHEARELVPGQNATTLQVAASVLAGVIWMMRNPLRGFLVPDELPYNEILEVAYPYLGPCPSVQTNWNPLRHRSRLFDRWGSAKPKPEDVWQFTSFLVD